MYSINELREQITPQDIFNLLEEWGGNPTYSEGCIVSDTICHNRPNEGSHKLYYYYNTYLFICYTGCDGKPFDIFELVIKVMDKQYNKEYSLYQAIQWLSYRLGLDGLTKQDNDEEELEDWVILDNYKIMQSRINPIQILKEYDNSILNKFNYNIKLTPWLNEHIKQEVLDEAKIGYYLGADQITIPHYDENDRLVGIRGRFMNLLDCELYGKYRPIFINGISYKHPLGLNLYNLNKSKENISIAKKAIIFEGEKSSLKFRSYFGAENDISVGCCGSNLSTIQVQKLLEAGAAEIIIGFDKQFIQLGDEEFNRWTKKLTALSNKYKNYVTVSFLFDKIGLLDYKSSPIDEGKEKFLTLLKNRIII